MNRLVYLLIFGNLIGWKPVEYVKKIQFFLAYGTGNRCGLTIYSLACGIVIWINLLTQTQFEFTLSATGYWHPSPFIRIILFYCSIERANIHSSILVIGFSLYRNLKKCKVANHTFQVISRWKLDVTIFILNHLIPRLSRNWMLSF